MNWKVVFESILIGGSVTALFWAWDGGHDWQPRIITMGLITGISLVLGKLTPKDKDL